MTPDLWILWAFLSLGTGTLSSQAAAFHTEAACEAAKARIVAEMPPQRVLGPLNTNLLVCTPNFQVSPK